MDSLLTRRVDPRLLLLGLAAAWGLAVGVACGGGDDDDRIESEASDAGAPPFAGSVTVDGAAAADAAAPKAASCARYCAEVTASCAGEHAQYRSEAECVRLCAFFETGVVVEEGNTAGCRERYAGSPAQTDPATYCPAAGPFGGGRCGDRCQAFCALAVATCAEPAPYADVPSCERACSGWALGEEGPDAGAKDAGTGEPDGADASARETLGCRQGVLRAIWADQASCRDLGDAGPCGPR